MDEPTAIPRTGAWRALASGAAIASAVLWPVHAHAGCRIETLELPVTMVGTRAIATVGIDGTSVPLMVDSGSFYSLLTDATAEQLKLAVKPAPRGMQVMGLTGFVETHMTTVDKLQLLNGDLPKTEFLVGGNEPGAGARGIMGRNLLAFTDIEYDLAHGAIRFVFPNKDCADSNMAYWAGSTPVSEIALARGWREELPSIRGKVKLNGHDVVALFDTGASTIVSLDAAQRAGVAQEDMTPGETIYGAGRGRTPSWTAPFESLALGDETILHNRLKVAPLDNMTDKVQMLVGIDFFLSHRIYVSKSQSRMFFTYGGGPVFALNAGAAASAADFDGAYAASASSAVTADRLARRGAASAARHDYAGALQDLDRACELDPTSAAWFAQRGTLHEALRQPAKALLDDDTALTLAPALADARLRRAWLQADAGHREAALQDLDTLDKTLAPQVPMRLDMARLYQRLDLQSQGVAQLDLWIASHPNDVGLAAAKDGRCRARMLLDVDLDKARADCDDAVDADSKNAAWLDTRAWLNLRLGKTRKAVADFDRSIALRPQSAETLYGRAIGRTRLGDAVQAQADFEAARRLRPAIETEMQHRGLSQEQLASPSAHAP